MLNRWRWSKKNIMDRHVSACAQVEAKLGQTLPAKRAWASALEVGAGDHKNPGNVRSVEIDSDEKSAGKVESDAKVATSWFERADDFRSAAMLHH